VVNSDVYYVKALSCCCLRGKGVVFRREESVEKARLCEVVNGWMGEGVD
jgi:hypothetical protein